MPRAVISTMPPHTRRRRPTTGWRPKTSDDLRERVALLLERLLRMEADDLRTLEQFIADLDEGHKKHSVR